MILWYGVSPVMPPRLVAHVSGTFLLLAAGCAETELTTDDVGDALYCESVATWPLESSDAELELLTAVNRARARGGRCGELSFEPATPLQLSPELRCAARIHANHLASRDRLTHEGKDETPPVLRIARAEYEGIPHYEVLAQDFEDASTVVGAWLESAPHCQAVLDPDMRDAGPGHVRTSRGDDVAWVLVLGAPRDDDGL